MSSQVSEIPARGAARLGLIAPMAFVQIKTEGIEPAGISIDAAEVDTPIERINRSGYPNLCGPWRGLRAHGHLGAEFRCLQGSYLGGDPAGHRPRHQPMVVRAVRV